MLILEARYELFFVRDKVRSQVRSALSIDVQETLESLLERL